MWIIKVEEASMRILLLEDEIIISDVVSEYLYDACIEVDVVITAKEAIRNLQTNDYEMAILDIMVPGSLNGVDVLKWIRSERLEIPVIMLSALSDEKTQVEAFDYDADDYVTKPFSPKLLLKRVEAAQRRYRVLAEKEMQLQQDIGLELMEDAYQFFYQGQSLNLTLTEYMILHAMYQNKQMIFTRDHLLDIIYRDDIFPSDRIIDAHIKNIRKKLPIDVIKTCKGIGYKYEVND